MLSQAWKFTAQVLLMWEVGSRGARRLQGLGTVNQIFNVSMFHCRGESVEIQRSGDLLPRWTEARLDSKAQPPCSRRWPLGRPSSVMMFCDIWAGEPFHLASVPLRLCWMKQGLGGSWPIQYTLEQQLEDLDPRGLSEVAVERWD